MSLSLLKRLTLRISGISCLQAGNDEVIIVQDVNILLTIIQVFTPLSLTSLSQITLETLSHIQFHNTTVIDVNRPCMSKNDPRWSLRKLICPPTPPRENYLGGSTATDSDESITDWMGAESR